MEPTYKTPPVTILAPALYFFNIVFLMVHFLKGVFMSEMLEKLRKEEEEYAEKIKQIRAKRRDIQRQNNERAVRIAGLALRDALSRDAWRELLDIFAVRKSDRRALGLPVEPSAVEEYEKARRFAVLLEQARKVMEQRSIPDDVYRNREDF